MSDVTFLSTHAGMNYKIPDSDKNAKFTQGRFQTGDEQVISYLRDHNDYGVTLTEMEQPKATMQVDLHFCKQCDAVFKTQAVLDAHVEAEHAGDNPVNEVEGNDQPAPAKYVCKKCGKGFNRSSALAGHARYCKG
jgi:hypothetical protein